MTKTTVRAGVAQYVDGVQVMVAGPDAIVGTLVPKLRAALALDLAHRGLRPLDAWPAVQVHRYVWTSADEWASTMLDPDAIRPPGMRELTDTELLDGRRPDLYQLELVTDAVPDPQQVRL